MIENHNTAFGKAHSMGERETQEQKVARLYFKDVTTQAEIRNTLFIQLKIENTHPNPVSGGYTSFHTNRPKCSL